MEELKNKIRQLFGNGKKNQWLVFLLIGLILLVIGIPAEEEEPAAETVVQEYEKTADKAEILEGKLEKVLSKVSGVGKTNVMITIKSDGKKLVEKDERTSTVTGTNTGTQENSREESTVYQKDQNGQESPYVTEETAPEILGVLVVAEGGGDPVIVAQITEAVQALFSIEVHKIKVMKMN